MLTPQQFQRGLRLDQYLASMAAQRETFRAHFIAAAQVLVPEVLRFFRHLPQPLWVVALTEDGNPDAVRDVPLAARLCAECSTLTMRLFRPQTHADVVRHVLADVGATPEDESGERPLPVIGFYTQGGRLIFAHVQRLPELSQVLAQRREAWIAAHPEVSDARLPWSQMSTLTRIRILQAQYALTPEERLHWWRKTLLAWQSALAQHWPQLTPQEK